MKYMMDNNTYVHVSEVAFMYDWYLGHPKMIQNLFMNPSNNIWTEIGTQQQQQMFIQ